MRTNHTFPHYYLASLPPPVPCWPPVPTTAQPHSRPTRARFGVSSLLESPFHDGPSGACPGLQPRETQIVQMIFAQPTTRFPCSFDLTPLLSHAPADACRQHGLMPKLCKAPAPHRWQMVLNLSEYCQHPARPLLKACRPERTHSTAEMCCFCQHLSSMHSDWGSRGPSVHGKRASHYAG